MLGKEHGLIQNEAFPAPLFMAGIQFMCQHYIANLYLWTYNRHELAKQDELEATKTWWARTRKFIPTSIATGLDIGYVRF